jgi:hypothetical protein
MHRFDAVMLDQESRLYFLHIPKTAGTSIRYWLWDAFAVEDFLECYDLRDLDAADSSRLEKARFYSGHFGPRLWLRVASRPTTVTFMREPVALAISQIRYLRSRTDEEARLWGSGAWARSLELARRADLSSLFTDPASIDEFSNTQVRNLAITKDYSGGGLRHWSPAALYDRARRTLETLDAVGLVERMQESLLLFAGQLGWPPRELPYRLNETPGSADEFDTVIRENVELLRETNSWDLKLYDFGRDLFEEQLGALRKKLGLNADEAETKDSAVAALRSALLERFLNRPLIGPAVRRGQLTQSAGFFLDGWEERVFWPPAKRWLRWAGTNGKSTLYLPLQRTSGPITARFEIFHYPEVSFVKDLEMQVDGERVPMTHSNAKAGKGIYFHVCKIKLPTLPSKAAKPWTMVSFAVPETPATDIAIGDGGERTRPFALGNIDLL